MSAMTGTGKCDATASGPLHSFKLDYDLDIPKGTKAVDAVHAYPTVDTVTRDINNSLGMYGTLFSQGIRQSAMDDRGLDSLNSQKSVLDELSAPNTDLCTSMAKVTEDWTVTVVTNGSDTNSNSNNMDSGTSSSSGNTGSSTSGTTDSGSSGTSGSSGNSGSSSSDSSSDSSSSDSNNSSSGSGSSSTATVTETETVIEKEGSSIGLVIIIGALALIIGGLIMTLVLLGLGRIKSAQEIMAVRQMRLERLRKHQAELDSGGGNNQDYTNRYSAAVNNPNSNLNSDQNLSNLYSDISQGPPGYKFNQPPSSGEMEMQDIAVETATPKVTKSINQTKTRTSSRYSKSKKGAGSRNIQKSRGIPRESAAMGDGGDDGRISGRQSSSMVNTLNTNRS